MSPVYDLVIEGSDLQREEFLQALNQQEGPKPNSILHPEDRTGTILAARQGHVKRIVVFDDDPNMVASLRVQAADIKLLVITHNLGILPIGPLTLLAPTRSWHSYMVEIREFLAD